MSPQLSKFSASSTEKSIEDEESNPTEVEISKVIDDASTTSYSHSRWAWLRAFYHSLVTIVGTGVLGFPYATAYFGWVGSTILITAVSIASFYTAMLLSSLQEKDQGTFSEVANAVMKNEKFSNYWVRPFQILLFFPASAVMMLVGGTALSTIESMSRGSNHLSETNWTAIMGAIVMALSLLPDLAHIWQVSLVGSVAAILITLYCIIGSGIAISENNDALIAPDYSRPHEEDNTEYIFGLLSELGAVLFGYGFHAVLPDIKASLHDKHPEDADQDMKKAITSAFSFAYPVYLVIALLGYAAFGVDVDSNVLVSMTQVLSNSAMFVVWSFVVVKTSTEATVFNQAAFTLLRDLFGLVDENDHLDHHPKNKFLDYIMRFIWVGLALCVSLFVPFFSDLTSVTAAVSITPLSFILPIVLWNKKHAETASYWRLAFHYIFMTLFAIMGIIALVGACYDIYLNER